MPVSYPAGAGGGTGGAGVSKLSELSDLDLSSVVDGSVIGAVQTPPVWAPLEFTAQARSWDLSNGPVSFTYRLNGMGYTIVFSDNDWDGYTPNTASRLRQLTTYLTRQFGNTGDAVRVTSSGTICSLILDSTVSSFSFDSGSALSLLGLTAGRGPVLAKPAELVWAAVPAGQLKDVASVSAYVQNVSERLDAVSASIVGNTGGVSPWPAGTWKYFEPAGFSNNATGNPLVPRLTLVPITITEETVIDEIALSVAYPQVVSPADDPTNGNVLRVGIYDTVAGWPANLVSDCGEVNPPPYNEDGSASALSVPVYDQPTLSAGLYWLAIVPKSFKNALTQSTSGWALPPADSIDPSFTPDLNLNLQRATACYVYNTAYAGCVSPDPYRDWETVVDTSQPLPSSLGVPDRFQPDGSYDQEMAPVFMLRRQAAV